MSRLCVPYGSQFIFHCFKTTNEWTQEQHNLEIYHGLCNVCMCVSPQRNCHFIKIVADGNKSDRYEQNISNGLGWCHRAVIVIVVVVWSLSLVNQQNNRLMNVTNSNASETDESKRDRAEKRVIAYNIHLLLIMSVWVCIALSLKKKWKRRTRTRRRRTKKKRSPLFVDNEAKCACLFVRLRCGIIWYCETVAVPLFYDTVTKH